MPMHSSTRIKSPGCLLQQATPGARITEHYTNTALPDRCSLGPSRGKSRFYYDAGAIIYREGRATRFSIAGGGAKAEGRAAT
jgi:hypothetical protein